MNGFVEQVVLGRRLLIPAAVALLLLLVWVEFPSASTDPYLGTSRSGACDILLLNSPRPVDQLVAAWQPDRVLSEMRSAALTDSLRRVLARYPRFLQPDEQAALAEMLLAEGERQDIDPLFLAALIRVESAFSKDAISNKGARGLMQVMPATGEEMAQRMGLEWDGPQGLHDPRLNVRLGSFYLRQLLDHYQGNYKRALTAYNRGPRNLRYLEQRHGGLRHQFTGYFRKIQQFYRTYQRSLGAGGALLQVG